MTVASPSPAPAAVAAPPPESLDYTEAVWELALRAGRQTDASAAGAVLASDPWVRRYLECAARSIAGRAPGGGYRTAWLSAQRRARAAGALPRGRIALLERLAGFTWTPDADRWRLSYERVAVFAATHGRIPARGDDLPMANWLAAQRMAWRLGRLDEHRRELLAALPGWTQSLDTARTRQVWEAQRELLRQFLADGDGCYPDPSSDNPDEAELGRWVRRQRHCHHRRDLSAARVAALEELPKWRWSERDAVFDWRICELQRDLGGAPIPSTHWLYGWVLSQRRRHRDGRLTDEQVDDLTRLGLLPPP